MEVEYSRHENLHAELSSNGPLRQCCSPLLTFCTTTPKCDFCGGSFLDSQVMIEAISSRQTCLLRQWCGLSCRCSQLHSYSSATSVVSFQEHFSLELLRRRSFLDQRHNCRSSLAEKFVLCRPPRGERVLFSICRFVSPFIDVTPSPCLHTAASSPLFAGYCSDPRHCSLRVGGSTVHCCGIAVAAGTRFPRVHPHALAVLYTSYSTSPPLLCSLY